MNRDALGEKDITKREREVLGAFLKVQRMSNVVESVVKYERDVLRRKVSKKRKKLFTEKRVLLAFFLRYLRQSTYQINFDRLMALQCLKSFEIFQLKVHHHKF